MNTTRAEKDRRRDVGSGQRGDGAAAQVGVVILASCLTLLAGACGGGGGNPKGTGGAAGTPGAAGATGAAGAGGAAAAGGLAGGGKGGQAAGGVGGSAAPGSFSVFVTKSPPGPTIAQNLWSGVLRFTVAGDGAPFVAAPGIEPATVADPVGLAYRAVSSEIFVGNRHGNIAGAGQPGSISRFIFDRATGTLTPNGTITGNGLDEVHQIAFHPTTGELFAANWHRTAGVTPTGGPAISRFVFDATGAAVPNGTLGTETTQGLAISPDGTTLYATAGGATSSVILQYDLVSGAVTTGATISAAPRLFQMAIRAGVLYVPAIDVNLVFRLTIGAAQALTLKDSFAADGPIMPAFSPDGLEMYVSGHLTSDLVDRFVYAAATDTWTPTEKVTTTSSLGSVLVVP